jgi:hypothetical protein
MRAKSAVFLVESQALAAEWNTSQSSKQAAILPDTGR